MAKLGTVVFEEDLIWVPSNEDVNVRGRDQRTLSGAIASARSPHGDEFRTYRFKTITYTDWQRLKSMAESGGNFLFTPKNGGPSMDVRFAQESALTLYRRDDETETVDGGEIRVIVSAKSKA